MDTVEQFIIAQRLHLVSVWRFMHNHRTLCAVVRGLPDRTSARVHWHYVSDTRTYRLYPGGITAALVMGCVGLYTCVQRRRRQRAADVQAIVAAHRELDQRYPDVLEAQYHLERTSLLRAT